jgi:cysteine desulfurase/selenocysteine lyase
VAYPEELQMTIESLILDEQARLAAFPIARKKIFAAHAGVTALPSSVADAMIEYIRRCCENHQEFGDVLRDIQRTRHLCAELINAQVDEIALLGPTSLGLSLFAHGLPWQKGDEVVCYSADYPANVYPWMDLERLGVKVVYLKPETPGVITPKLVAAALSSKTRLVALASCNFLTGYRIDVDAIGRCVHEAGALFSLDAIQTLGAFPCDVEHVDFLSADAHKWMLGPMAIGIVYVKKRHFDLLRPTLLGAWNVNSPNFITQKEIAFPESGRRYEPGVLNAVGIYGMHAALGLLLGIGIHNIANRLLELKTRLISNLLETGCVIIPPDSGPNASSITTFRHTSANMAALMKRYEESDIVVSLRFDSTGTQFIRVSPHFYNTVEEIDRIVAVLKSEIAGR